MRTVIGLREEKDLLDGPWKGRIMRKEKHTGLRDRLVRVLNARGIPVSIGELKVRPFGQTVLTGLTVGSPREGRSRLEAERATLLFSFWQSLFRLSVIGEVTLEGVCIRSSRISALPFRLGRLSLTGKLGLRKKAVYVEAGEVGFLLRRRERKGLREWVFRTDGLTWNAYQALMDGHLGFDLLRSLRSDDPVSCSACYIAGKHPRSHPLFKARIDWDGFRLDACSGASGVTLDRAFLYGAARRRLGEARMAEAAPLEKVPSYAVDAVLSTEDPDFWDHKGISPRFVGYAIRENLRQKKIVRGASTITMQLVRNLFLTPERSLCRKAEECVVSLLLENYYRIDKRTLLELYFNVIEFGPDVYGLPAASRFYFGHDYTELSPTEALVLTYIIPRPGHFYEALVKRTEQLRGNLSRHILLYAPVVRKRGHLTDAEYAGIGTTVHFGKPFGTWELGRPSPSTFTQP